jgi:Tfp pilus assembly protein PilF
MISLLQNLLEFYKEDPKDPFNIYGLAIEYLKTDIEKTRELFEELLQNHEEYIPTYYHAAALYLAIGNKEFAENTFRKGIEIATKLNKYHALNELKRAYQSFLYEEYD